MRIEILNPVESRVSQSDGKRIRPCLTYKAQFWKSIKIGNRTRKERREYPKDVFICKDDRHWYFHTGLVSKVEAYCKRKNIPVKTIEEEGEKIVYKSPKLPDITLRLDQKELIELACIKHRGVIQAPTGTGKTILQMGVISCFPQFRTLLLAHTIGIIEQTYNELKEKGFKNVQRICGGDDRTLVGDIVVSTMQSFVKIPPKEYADYFQCVIQDEAHRISKPNGTYGKILSNLNSQIRLAFTATLPTSPEAKFALTGLIGPLIGRQTINEAADLDILAKPKIRLIRTPKNNRVYDIRNYREAYDEGIVNNTQRNKLVMETAKEYIDEGKSVLIFVSKIEHGKNLQEIGHLILREYIPFVQGSMEKDTRDQVKNCLIDKSVLCVISTTVWREGMNIPTLDVVINACGGKSEIMTLQTIGRGLRKTEDKDEVIIVDYFDPSNFFFISHFGERVTLFFDQGWM